MAETNSFTYKPQRVATTKNQENNPNPSKFYTHFLYKAVIVSIFVLVLPLFPSQAPEFINRTLHTRSWELLQLIFVGIAVSYGLFSKRNDETEKEYISKFDNAQSYVSRLLQVSSVFDDETESPSGTYENKVQTWNSQYYRGQPNIVVAPESSVHEEQRGTSSRIGEKPLLLPVRSLKSRVTGPVVVESSNESSVKGGSLNRTSSNPGSKRFSRNSSKSRTEGFVGVTPLELGEKAEESIVLRSPIPWRSRSGRMEMKEDVESPPQYSLPPSMEESELNKLESRSFSSQSSRSSRTNSTSPSPQNLSPSPSLTSEFQAKNVEDLVRRKGFHKSTPPPAPPPPPPPPFHRKSPLMKSTSSVKNDDFKRSIRSVPMELNGSDREDPRNRANSGEGAEWWTRTSSDGSLMGKSVRTLGQNEAVQGAAKTKTFSEDFAYVKEEKRSNEVESTFKTNGAKQNFSVLPKEETDEDDSETDDDDDDEFEEIAGNDEKVAHNDGGPDVDKKADEFIAKFREQIRLQRIASIRRSTGQLPRNSVR